MRVINKKQMALITAGVLLFAVAVCGTLAYVITSTLSVENTFTPSDVACAVLENGSEEAHYADMVNGITEKSSVKIKNTGNTEAYIRVALVVTWKSADGRVWAQTPVEGESGDYTMSISSDGWLPIGDYYYYTKPVAAGETTKVLVNSASLNAGKTPPVGTDGTPYYLDIEIVASAIQSTPVSVASDEWGVTVSGIEIVGW